jgi:hypothetical protein
VALNIGSAKEFGQWLLDTERAYSPIGDELARRGGIDMCYAEGYQWLQAGSGQQKGSWEVRFPNWNPDTNQLRAVQNITTQNLQKAEAATWPDKMECEAFGPPGGGTVAARTAQVAENAVNALIPHMNYVAKRRDVNFRRCIWGSYGIGLSLTAFERNVKTGDFEHRGYDCVLKAFEFEPTQLVLDPGNQNRDLREHDFVVYRAVWSAAKIRRVLGLQLDENKLKTIGQLTPMQQAVAKLSHGRLYRAFMEHSETKGAVVIQAHIKGDDGRFGEMIVAVREGGDDDELRIVNEQNRESPFGGSGLPLALLHAHRRPDALWGISDVSMLRDTQDRTNLASTMLLRMMQKNAAYQWLVPMGCQPRDMSEEEFGHRFHNYVGGIIMYDDKRAMMKPGQTPQLVQYPQPQGFYQDAIQQYKMDARESVHRSDLHYGQVKTHVPDASNRMALEQGDQVLGIRVREDMDTDAHLLTVALGTLVRHAREGSPNLLSILQTDAGFGPEDFGVLSEIDPVRPGVTLALRESSLRHRSHNARRQDLMDMLTVQGIPPQDVRMALARDLDRPLTELDHTIAQDAERAALAVLHGEEWMPLNMGPYGGAYIDAFRRALTDRHARRDPSALDRLNRAIISQTTTLAQEQAMLTAPAEGGNPTQATEAEQLPEEAALATVLTALEGGAGSSGVPAPAAA